MIRVIDVANTATNSGAIWDIPSAPESGSGGGGGSSEDLVLVKAQVEKNTQNITLLQAISHTHENKTLLDQITPTRVNNWDNAEKNANTYTDNAIKNIKYPVASTTLLGMIKVDGKTLQVIDEVVSVKEVNVNLLTQTEGDVLILNGGSN